MSVSEFGAGEVEYIREREHIPAEIWAMKEEISKGTKYFMCTQLNSMHKSTHPHAPAICSFLAATNSGLVISSVFIGKVEDLSNDHMLIFALQQS